MKTTIWLFFVLICLFGCKKDSNSSSTNWHVKYEVTSTNSKAVISIIYRDESGSIKTIGTSNPSNPITVPWTYESDWSKDAGLTVARSLSLTALTYNLPSTDAVTLKIYVDGKVVNQTTTSMVTYLLTP